MTTRQELYDRIRQSSKDEVILEEMIRLGFWTALESMPSNPAEEIRRQGELERELRSLTIENTRLQNAESIRREQLNQRLEESKRKRLERKQRRLREREQKAEAWKQSKRKDILFLGSQFSAGLAHQVSDAERIQRLSLPQFDSPADLARAMGIPLGLLRFLAFGRRTSQVSHYQRFAIKKKTGGVRMISAPMPRLKLAQRWINEYILFPVALHSAAHGFRRERSIVTNAEQHVRAKVVINIDLKDFFPTITYPRIKGVFRNLGYSESIAIIFALMCSEANTAEIEVDRQSYFVARGARTLPQGAPTSPAITNLICRGLDARLSKIAQLMGFVYTRYADDITFSSASGDVDVGRAIRRIKHVVSDENFVVHPDKTRVLRSGRRLEVTGLTVNQRVNVSRKQLRNFRATLFQIEKDGPAGKHWGTSPDVMAAIAGFANFVAMVDPDRGQQLQEQVAKILEKHGRGHFQHLQRERWVDPLSQSVESSIPPIIDARPPKRSKSKSAKKKQWWKFW